MIKLSRKVKVRKQRETLLISIPKAKYELGFIIFSGLNDALDNNKMDKELLEELLNWYKNNVMISYSNLKEKFDNINK